MLITEYEINIVKSQSMQKQLIILDKNLVGPILLFFMHMKISYVSDNNGDGTRGLNLPCFRYFLLPLPAPFCSGSLFFVPSLLGNNKMLQKLFLNFSQFLPPWDSWFPPSLPQSPPPPPPPPPPFPWAPNLLLPPTITIHFQCSFLITSKLGV